MVDAIDDDVVLVCEVVGYGVGMDKTAETPRGAAGGERIGVLKPLSNEELREALLDETLCDFGGAAYAVETPDGEGGDVV